MRRPEVILTAWLSCSSSVVNPVVQSQQSDRSTQIVVLMPYQKTTPRVGRG